ncbi:MAG TPA: hypothetical protein DER09_13590 [Prolixibacteraceae bacterium]|nr:hypothetical protein [Prolixibacteraceae bacterium]
MQTDRLEEFIKNNREEFDNLEPSPEVWAKIASKSKRTKTVWLKHPIFKVAAILVLAVIFSVLMMNNDEFAINRNSVENIDPEMVELIEAEAYYAGQVSKKMEEIKKCYDTFPEIKDDVEADLNELQEMYNTLKTDLGENISKKEVIEAMIENNRHRLKMVDEVLEQINC